MNILFLVLFLFQACGHEQTILEEESFDSAPPLSQSGNPKPKNTPEENVASDSNPNQNLPPGACQDFIQSVVSFEPGPGAGYGQPSLPQIVFGPPQGAGTSLGGLHALSLGEGGIIVVDMAPCLIMDESGVDFIVFENAFWIGGNSEMPFAELAEVSVSEDGENFVSFPCYSDAYPYTGCAGWHPVLSHPQNAISPFDSEAAGGDPFDLAEIGVAQARFIKIEDISGGGFPPSVGFDLDAIAVIHGSQVVIASSP